jgi:hypothetical protein
MDENKTEMVCPFMSRQQLSAGSQGGYYLNVVYCFTTKCGAWSPIFKCCGFSMGGLKEGRH